MISFPVPFDHGPHYQEGSTGQPHANEHLETKNEFNTGGVN
jgi:hypothetical protein